MMKNTQYVMNREEPTAKRILTHYETEAKSICYESLYNILIRDR
jgi:hypothetical protein